MIEREVLHHAVANAGGGDAALGYLDELLKKIRVLEGLGRYDRLLDQVLKARTAGNFRGLALEINIAAAFESKEIALQYECSQGQSGTVDFGLDVEGKTVFLETKLLQQDQATKVEIAAQIEASGEWQKIVVDDKPTLARLQQDIIYKGSQRKFSPTPKPDWINLVAIDVSELQLGAIDVWDCLLAAAGNAAVAQHGWAIRPGVVGLFEQPAKLTAEDRLWVDSVQRSDAAHVRDYLHGVLFLFREPHEGAALAYDLSGFVAWNRLLIKRDASAGIAAAIHRAIPLPR